MGDKAEEYSQCVISKGEGVKLNECAAQFAKLRNCIDKEAKRIL